MSGEKYRIHTPGYKAVILYPALVTPCIVGPDGCLTIILALEEKFKREIFDNNVKPKTKSEIAWLPAKVLHSQLSFAEWGTQDLFDVSKFVYEATMRRLIDKRNMIYSDHKAALAAHKSGKYQGWYLGRIDTPGPIEGVGSNGEARMFGTLHAKAIEMYQEQGYTELFQLNFRDYDVRPAGMHEVAFTYFAILDQDQLNEKALEENANYSYNEITDKESKPFCLTDPDDDMLNRYLEQKWLKFLPKVIRAGEKIEAQQVLGGNKMHRLLDLQPASVTCAYLTCPKCRGDNPERHKIHYVKPAVDGFLQSRHPVYIPGASWRNKLGVMGDLHISSKQSVLKMVKPQIIPGADESDSPSIGGLVHECLDSVLSIMDTIGDKCDVLALVGDLWDHVVNLDPHHFVEEGKSSITTKELWEELEQAEYANFDKFPKYIDLMMCVSLISNFYAKKKKPVIAITGNHEPYEKPYGLSPNILGKKLNPGVPADHNLTRQEATLLNGPSFGVTGASLSSETTDAGLLSNFRKALFELFYTMLTPWSNFIVPYGESINFIALEWGNTEYLWGKEKLPTATSSLDTNQKALIESCGAKRGTNNIVLIHAPLVGYHLGEPLKQTVAMEYDELSGLTWGTFTEERKYIFDKLKDKDVNLLVSGHAHRAAIYSLEDTGGKVSVTGHLGINEGKEKRKKVRLSENDKVVVCGSAGPCSKQNLAGKFKGLLRETPQGLILDYGDSRQVEWVESSVGKPRLAVLLDYLFFEGVSAFGGSAIDFQRTLEVNSSFEVLLDEDFLRRFEEILPAKSKLFTWGEILESISLFSFDKKMDRITLRTELKNNNGIYSMSAAKDELARFEKSLNPSKSKVFLSIKFKDNPSLRKHFDLSTPWCYPISFLKNGSGVLTFMGRMPGDFSDLIFYGQFKEL